MFRQADSLAAAEVVSQASSRRHLFYVAAAIIGLLMAHWTLGTSALRNKCTTCDEIVHLAAGCSYWLKNDYRLQPENGNLPQRWHALPVVMSGAKLPPDEDPAWKTSEVWKIGRAFFYDMGNDSEQMLARGRAMAALLSVATCLVVFLWSRRLFGLHGAFLSLGLAVFCPAMLAHGPLMTSDMCLTLFLLLSTWAVWELLQVVTPLRLFAGVLAIAGLFLAKMSAVLMIPIAGILVLVRLWSSQGMIVRFGSQTWHLDSVKQKLAAAMAMALVCGAFTYTVVWAAYGFRYEAFAEGPLTDAKFFKLGDIETAAKAAPGRATRAIAWLAEHRVLPEAYLYGAAYVLAHQKRAAFLNGEYSISGWRHYFPYCFAVKTPLALFGLLGLALAARVAGNAGDGSRVKQPRPLVAALMPLIVLFAIYWLTAIQTTLNIGYRHILPMYPVLYIFVGSAGQWLKNGNRMAAAAVIGLVILFAADSLAAYPNYIAYFNQLMPREQAYKHLVDSNLDWGQDLPGLARWLSENNTGKDKEPVYLAYFGNGRPAHHGIDAVALPPPIDIRDELPLSGGLYCISATTLQGVYEDAPGRWNKTYEERYQSRRRLFERVDRGEPAVADDGHVLTAAEVSGARSAFEYGKYLRLMAYLRGRQPDANVGYSILIFRVSAEEVERALNGPPAELEERPWLPHRVKHL
jgi:hypothetical protein